MVNSDHTTITLSICGYTFHHSSYPQVCAKVVDKLPYIVWHFLAKHHFTPRKPYSNHPGQCLAYKGEFLDFDSKYQPLTSHLASGQQYQIRVKDFLIAPYSEPKDCGWAADIFQPAVRPVRTSALLIR